MALCARRYVAIVALSAVAAGSEIPAVEADSIGSTGSLCYPRHSRTVLQTRHLRVYAVPDRGRGRSFALQACDLAAPSQVSLDDPGGDEYAFLPPALRVNGAVIGWATEVCDPDLGCATTVHAFQLAPGARPTADGLAGPKGHRIVKLGSLVVRRDAALAWIACPERRPSALYGRRSPNCLHAGDRDYVLRQKAASREREVLDVGRKIDPSSLRLLGHGHISWVHAGRRRTATLR